MTEELKKEQEGKKEEVEKSEPTITEDELIKCVQDLEGIIKARKKPEEEPEEEEPDEDDEEEKSVTGNFEEDETIAKAIEVSDFLSALVDQTETSLDAVGSRFGYLEKSVSKFDAKYIEALSEVGKLVKGLTDSIKDQFAKMDTRLKTIEDTPSTPARSVMKSGKVLEKSFGAGTETGDSIDQLPKRRIVELLEKAVADGKVKDSELFSYEGSPVYILPKDTKEILKSYIG